MEDRSYSTIINNICVVVVKCNVYSVDKERSILLSNYLLDVHFKMLSIWEELTLCIFHSSPTKNLVVNMFKSQI